PVVFEGAISRPSCCKLDTDKFVAFYKGSGGKAYACAFTVSGTTPTAGALKEIDSNAISSTSIECAQLDTDKFVIAWSIPDSWCKLEICAVSGTTISEGTEYQFEENLPFSYVGMAKVNGSHFIIVYRGGASDGQYRYCTFSGLSITAGVGEGDFGYLPNAGSCDDTDVCLLSALKVAAVYWDSEYSDSWAVVGDYTPGWSGKISGVTNPAKIMGVDVANIAKVKGVASA
ncbi:unnamed protein product, partial [marine sediment metagenome]